MLLSRALWLTQASLTALSPFLVAPGDDRQVLGASGGARSVVVTSNDIASGPQSSYDSYAKGYDVLDGGPVASALGIEGLRKLCRIASGRVLDVSIGTGLNLAYYDSEAVTSVDACDLSTGMLQQAEARAAALRLGKPITFHQMDVEQLGFADETFDTVVDTFSLCVYANPGQALSEMRRVCKRSGRVLLAENSRSAFGPLAAYQDATAQAIRAKSKGCAWNQDVEALARSSGLEVRSSQAAATGLFRFYECVPV